MDQAPGWYADPLPSGRLRLWDGRAWTDRTQARPVDLDTPLAGTRRLERRRTQAIDLVTAVVVVAFVIGIVELGWRRSAFIPAAPALAVSTHAVTSNADGSTNVDDVVTEPPSQRAAVPPTTHAVSPASPRVPTTSPGRPETAGNATQPFGSSPRDFTLTGYTWKPCKVITVTSSGPNLTAIVAEMAAISGLNLQVTSGPADIAVAWGAVAIPHAIGVTEGTASGRFFIHVTITLAPRGASSLSSLLRHELGHAVGLGHAEQTNEIMYPVLRSDAPSDYQAGDRAGLRTIGAMNAGC